MPLTNVLVGLGNWPVVTGNWSEKSWDLEFTVASMRGLYNAPILVDSWVAADDKNSSVHILQVIQQCSSKEANNTPRGIRTDSWSEEIRVHTNSDFEGKTNKCI